MQTRFCHKCGSALKPGAKFCGTCGNPIAQQPAPTPAPAPAPVPAKKQPREKRPSAARQTSGSRGIGKSILAVILCVLIFFFSVVSLGLFNLRLALTGGCVSETLRSTLSYSRLEKMPADTLFTDAASGESVLDWAVEAIEDAYANDDNPIAIHPDSIEEFLEDSTLLDFLCDEVDIYLVDLITKTGLSGITSSELRQLLEENIDLISDLSGQQMGAENVDYIVAQIENTGLLDYTAASALKENTPAVYHALNIGLSYWVIGLFALLALLFTLLLAKCNNWNVPRTCGDAGVILTIHGGILVLFTVFSMVLPDLWGAMFGSAYLVSILTGAILANSLICSAVVLGLGVALILVKCFCKKK